VSVQADPRIGSELLGYRIEVLLGRGGMGVVYLAYDARLKRRVALKLVAPELSEDPGFRERFLAETELAASLEHPNVVPVYDAGEVDGQLYLAMRYVEGADLKTLLAREHVLPPRRALAICGQIADALDSAHARGLVHRDVKPSNVLLDADEHVYLADFGLTRRIAEEDVRAGPGLSLGTPAYVSPEQIEGGDVDGRADVYSLACLVHELLTGETPFRGESELAVLWAHLQEEPPRASKRNATLPDAIDDVIARGLAKDPAERPSSCCELVDAARAALGLREVVVVRDRRPVLLGAAAAALAIGAGAAAIVLGGRDGAENPATAVSDRTLVRLDPETREVAAAVDVGVGLKAVAVGGRTAWVYNVTEGTITAIDTETNEVERVSRISTVPGESSFWNGPLIAADAGGAWVVGSRGGEGMLTRVRPGNPYHLEHPLPSVPAPIAVARGLGSVWVLTRYASLFDGSSDEAVLRISPRTGEVVGRGVIPVPPGPGGGTVYGIAVGERAVWVTNAEHGVLYRIDPASLAITGTVELGSILLPPSLGHGFVWTVVQTPERSRLLRIDPRTLSVTRIRAACACLDVARAGGSMWWNGMRSGTIVEIDPRSGRAVSTIRVTPDGPRAALLGSAASASIAAGAGGVWATVSPEAS
jgi:tRNA A-37 threonylcarbamoyl transferase component Bud32/streptogramin lyase